MPEIYLNVPSLVRVTGNKKIQIEGDTVAETIAALDRQFPGFQSQLIGDNGNLKGYLMISARYQDGTQELIANLEDTKQGLKQLLILPIVCGG